MKHSQNANSVAALLVTLALAGCNSSAPAPEASAPASSTAAAAAPDLQLPFGATCTSDIERWQAIQKQDLQMGHVGTGVNKQIEDEIGNAAAVCRAGRSAEASAMVRASKARHGYPAS